MKLLTANQAAKCLQPLNECSGIEDLALIVVATELSGFGPGPSGIHGRDDLLGLPNQSTGSAARLRLLIELSRLALFQRIVVVAF